MSRAYTPAEALKVHGRVARSSGTAVADQWLTAKGFGRLLGEAHRRRAAVTEAAAPAAKKAGKRKKAALAAEAELIGRLVTESLTAAQAPAPPPGTGPAPQADAGDGSLLSLGTSLESPFWRPAGPPAAAEAPEPAKPLHEMSTDELRAHAAGTFPAAARANGFRSPSWQR